MENLWFNEITFASPNFLYLLLLIPALIGWYIFRHFRSRPGIQISSFSPFSSVKGTVKQYAYHSLFTIRMIAITLLIFALARPQSSFREEDITVEGIDIMISFDISGSMLAEDLKPNRIEAAKDIAIEFIQGRKNDRIGLVAFSGESFTQCPLTTDHHVLINLFREIRSGMIRDGTAIGDGLATAVNRLRDSQAVSRVIILITDGINNMGSVDPLTAAEMASMFGIRVYAIGVGTIGQAPYPVITPFGKRYEMVDVRIDEELMKQIAAITGGRYFRATDNQTLRNIYTEIDRLEKSKIDVTEYHHQVEEFRPLALLALLLLAFEIITRLLIFRSTP